MKSETLLRQVNLLLTVDEAAEQLRMSPGYVRKAIREGRLPRVKLGTAVRIRFRDLEFFTAANCDRVGESDGSSCNHGESLAGSNSIYGIENTAGDRA